MGIFDLHCHLLPKIDDSEVSVEGLSRILGIYKECGFEGVAFTPHIYNPFVTTDVASLRDTWQSAHLEAEQIGLRTYLGSELYIGEQRELCSIPIAGKYSLVEFPTVMPCSGWFEKLMTLARKGLIPIIAHVERYRWLNVRSEDFARLKGLGSLIQVNVEGIEDGTALSYLEADMVDVLATDNHGKDELAPAKLITYVDKWPRVLSRMEAMGL
ncbi:MAG: CpsB/CapC family capsule biosynthesis tyrosine phosphatase [Sphaerochaetaceae bacterium]